MHLWEYFQSKTVEFSCLLKPFFLKKTKILIQLICFVPLALIKAEEEWRENDIIILLMCLIGGGLAGSSWAEVEALMMWG